MIPDAPEKSVWRDISDSRRMRCEFTGDYELLVLPLSDDPKAGLPILTAPGA